MVELDLLYVGLDCLQVECFVEASYKLDPTGTTLSAAVHQSIEIWCC